MPDPSNYDNESDWMSACVPAVMDEGRTNEQAVAQCLSMWSNKHEKSIFHGVIFKCPLCEAGHKPTRVS
jgi:hypothetical protein